MNSGRISGCSLSARLVGACALALVTGVVAGSSRSWAHSNGHESRTPEQCQRLPGTDREGERAQCLRCVERPKPHHYHPDYPAGERCRPDDGRP